ncbi:MAG: hypothetical protein K0R38_6660 [Polyangiaceae bacterium]|nr:hypothetical protein [Polyangiaceae bacterium]
MTARVWLVLLLLTSPVYGQLPTSEAVAAHVRFKEGVEHARRGDVARALASFEAAYTIRPHFSVLYNIAQAHSALGNPVEAIATFERYLAEGGSQLPGSRREAVEQLIEVERQRIGQLVLHVPSARDTRVWLDGRELASDRHDQPITLKVGDHSLLYSRGAGHPVTLAFTVAAGQTSSAFIPAPRSPSPSQARLEVQCDVPDIEVTVDGNVVAPTAPRGPLLVDVGLRRVGFSRPGYVPTRVDMDVKPDRVNEVGCHLRWQARPDSSVTSRFFLHATPRARPPARHSVRVERDGYLPHSRSVWLRAGAIVRQEVALAPTAAQRQRDAQRRSQRRTWGGVLAAASASSLTAAGALYAWNGGRFDDLRSTSGDTRQPPSPGQVASTQRVDDAAIGLGAVGLSLAIAAAWTLLSPHED